MNRFLLTCPEHGSVELPSSQLDLVGFEVADSKRYRCPIGKEIVLEKIDPRDAILLEAYGCNVMLLNAPIVITGPDTQSQISEQDLKDFHDSIESIGHMVQREIFDTPS